MHKKSDRLILAGILLISVSLFYFAESHIRSSETKEERKTEYSEFKEKKTELPGKKNSASEKNSSFKHVKDGTLGFIEIKKLNIIMPIFKDTSEQSLKDGSGIVEGTDSPSGKDGTTTVIAGHRGGYNGEESFLNIDKLKKGDTVVLETDAGKLEYRVSGSEIIEPDDWSKFYREPDKARLILLSCHPYPRNDKRILIYCERKE